VLREECFDPFSRAIFDIFSHYHEMDWSRQVEITKYWDRLQKHVDHTIWTAYQMQRIVELAKAYVHDAELEQELHAKLQEIDERRQQFAARREQGFR
jgi:hypothetical protein